MKNTTNPKVHHGSLGPASSSPLVSGLSVFCLFVRNKSPSVLLKLRARVIRDQLLAPSVSNDLLNPWLVLPSFAGDVPNSSSLPSPDKSLCDPDFVL
jgi:hypothetical protein